MSELAPGSRVGVFEVIGLLGEGGMGKVYRARDTRLNREVALKILPDAFAADPDRLARFTREAQTLAALNDPHIAHIHGLEESSGVRALVMELVEGEDLSQRLARGAMPPDEALPIARQIAEALEAAHELGIIHRDLKPANIKVRPDGTVKVLDFGLAKALDPLSSRVDTNNSPTLSIHATQAGVILGTAAYMSPEQARGRPTDKRSDVWSFGCVLFEMLSGKRAFDGEDATEIIAAVVKMPPDWTALPADVPAPIVTLIRRCLEKDRKLRIGDIAVARFLMSDGATLAAPTSASAPARSPIGIIVGGAAAVLAVALAALAVIHFGEQPPVAKVVRFQVAPPPGETGFGSAAALLSPDGTLIAFSARGASGATQLWVQPLDSLTARPLPGTDSVGEPFWSPDSRYLGFPQRNRLKKLAVAGGVPETVCELPMVAGAWRSAAWGPGEIIFSNQGSGLMRVSDAGGTPVPLTKLDAARRETFHGAPWFLPDGRHFLYFRNAGAGDEHTGIYVGSLDARPEQQSTDRLVANAYHPVYTPSLASPGGWLLFVRESSLVAQSFDAQRLELGGEALPMADGLFVGGAKPFSASLTGNLAYRSGASTGQRRLVWFDRSGKSLETVGESGDYNTVSLSPDGTRAAVSNTTDPIPGGAIDLWAYDFARGTSTRLTVDPSPDWLTAWSPDGERIIFSSARSGNYDLYRIGSNGAGKEEVVFQSPQAEYAQDWSRDGRFLLYSTQPEQGTVSTLDLSVLDLEAGAKPQPYLNSEFLESQGRFSPDGRFVAYTSNASGQNQVYVQTFPNAQGGKWMISSDGGTQPRWRRDGRELFFISADSKMMAVDVTTAPVFAPGIPKVLFDAPIFGGGQTNNVTRYDVSADGKRFLINAVLSETRGAPITVVLNWEGILKR